MIVSCDACKSRYKLDDSKISGRGAKITCPKCKHVFVVAAPVDPSPPPRPPPGPGTPSDWEDNAPTRLGKVTDDLRPAVHAASAPPPATAPDISVREVASVPGAKAARDPAAPASEPGPAEPGASVEKVVTYPPVPSKSAADAPARAAALDFRKVGVAAWKVKVKIGLVYDFSDIKTLRRYIADGRVTSGDVISHDAKTWKPLGEIKDLDLFFCETYDRLQAAGGRQPAAAAGEGPAPADLGALAAALAEGAAQERSRPVSSSGSGRTSPAFSDPFEVLKQRRKDSSRDTTRRTASGSVASPHAPPPSGRGRALALFAVLALVTAAAVVKYTADHGGGHAPTILDQKKRKEAAKLKAIKSEVEAQVEELGASVPKEEPEAAEPIPNGDVLFLDGGQVVVPVTPPKGALPVVALPGAAPMGAAPAPAMPPPPASTQTQRDTSAADFEAAGDAEMREGKPAEAADAYQRAIQAGASGGGTQRKLGVALKLVGDTAGASAALGKAKAQGDAQASCELGDLHEGNGDTPSAITEFTTCLSGKPPNAADIRGRLDRLKGGT